MRKAVIDMGTNTFNLLIADVIDRSFKTIYSTKEPVLLGMGGINDNRLAKPAIARALLAVKKFTQKCDAFNVDRKNVLAIGTSALRGAANSAEFLEKVKALFEIDVRIVSGEDEAFLIYNGVRLSHDFLEPGIIMDIGGGSTEFIYANNLGVKDVVSLDTGVSRIFQFLDFPTVFSSDDLTRIFDFMDAHERDLLKNFSTSILIGASGGFKTFYELIYEEPYLNSMGTIELNFELLIHQLNVIVYSSLEFRQNNIWIIPIRKTMLPVVAAQILWLIEKSKIKRVLVSPYALKEGVIAR